MFSCQALGVNASVALIEISLLTLNSPSGGSFAIRTATANDTYQSGLGVDGTYNGGKSVVNLKAFGVYSGGPYSSDLAFYTTSTTTSSEKMRIDSAGNLGLGVTPSANDFSAVLQTGWVGHGITPRSATNLVFNMNANHNGGGWRYGNNGASALYVQSDSGHAWATAPSGTAGNPITFTQAMTLDASGNLLVGTTSNAGGDKAVFNGNVRVIGNQLNVSAGTSTNFEFVNRNGAGFTYYVNNATTQAMTLDASGNLVVGGTSAVYGTSGRGVVTINGSANALLGFTVGGLDKGFVYHSGTDMYLSNTVSGNVIVQTNNTERARIDSAGNLGIGTSSPESPLQVATRFRVQSDGVVRWGSSVASSGYSESGYLSWDTGKIRIGYEGSGAVAFGNSVSGDTMLLNSSGNLGIGTTSPAQKLHVNGNARLSNGTGFTTANSTIRQIDSVAGAENQFTVSSVSFLTGDYSDAGQISFSTAQGAGLVERMRLDSAGNLGLGVTPSAWGALNYFKAVQVGNRGGALAGNTLSYSSSPFVFLTNNSFFQDSDSTFRYVSSQPAVNYRQFNGEHAWYNAPSGTAGNAISLLL